GGMARSDAHRHVGDRDQEPAMRPTHRVAVPRLERQAHAQMLAFGLEPQRADQSDEFVGGRKPAKAFGNERLGHVIPSLEAANRSRARRTAGSNGVLRWVSSLSDTMTALSTAVQLPSPSNSAWPITHLRSCTSSSRAQAVARPG